MDSTWILASLIFLIFMFLFWRFGNDPLRSFSIRQRFEEDELDDDAKKFREIFLNEFDGYLASVNARNRYRYWVAAGAFFAAFLISLLLLVAAG